MKSYAGFSLFEVLISLILLTFLLLGLDSFLLLALKKSKTAFYTAMAESQLTQIQELLKTHGPRDYHTVLIAWNKQNKALLPHGKGTIEGYYPNLRLAITWGNNGKKLCKTNQIGYSGCLQRVIHLSGAPKELAS